MGTASTTSNSADEKVPPAGTDSCWLDAEALSGRLTELYRVLRAEYGPQQWWPARHSFEMCVGAILVQNTTWANARRALHNIEARGADSVTGIAMLSQAELAELVRPSGYYNQKAAKLAAFCEHVLDGYGGDLGKFLSVPLERLREELLGIWGIGAETADAIILYAGKQPTFVIDTYTVRLLDRLGIVPGDVSRKVLRDAVMAALDPDVEEFAEMHALIIQHGKEKCRKTPRCAECVLLANCRYGERHGVPGVRRVRPVGSGADIRPR